MYISKLLVLYSRSVLMCFSCSCIILYRADIKYECKYVRIYYFRQLWNRNFPTLGWINRVLRLLSFFFGIFYFWNAVGTEGWSVVHTLHQKINHLDGKFSTQTTHAYCPLISTPFEIDFRLSAFRSTVPTQKQIISSSSLIELPKYWPICMYFLMYHKFQNETRMTWHGVELVNQIPIVQARKWKHPKTQKCQYR